MCDTCQRRRDLVIRRPAQRGNFNIVQTRRFAAVGMPDNLHRIGGLELDIVECMPRRRVPIHLVGWQMVVRCPRADLMIVDTERLGPEGIGGYGVPTLTQTAR